MSDRTYRDGFPFTVDYDQSIENDTTAARPARKTDRGTQRAAPSAGMPAGKPAADRAIGPDVTEDLPSSNDVRWVRRRKAQVVAAVRGGILTLSDALARYSLSLEEFIEWEREVGHELQERRRTGRLRELTKSRHGAGRTAH